jgi:hypothetical protein
MVRLAHPLLLADLLDHHRARLDAQDDPRISSVKLLDAPYVHVGRDRHALLSLAQKPWVEVLYLFGDLIEQGPLVGQPHVLERVQLATSRYVASRSSDVLISTLS